MACDFGYSTIKEHTSLIILSWLIVGINIVSLVGVAAIQITGSIKISCQQQLKVARATVRPTV